MRRVISVIMVVSVFLSSFVSAYAINVIIDGQEVVFTEDSGYPFIDQSNRTQVPFRQVMERFGCVVSWNPATQETIAQKGDITVTAIIGDDSIIKNGKSIKNDTSAVIKDSRTYLPIRAVLEAFAAEVIWHGETETVVVSTKREETPWQEIKVSTAEEFVNAIGSNREIILAPGKYDLSTIKHQNSSDHTAAELWESVEDGRELVIQNVSNLTIRGSETGKTELVTSPRFAEVMTFVNSRDITIVNITAGHAPIKGYTCEAGVLKFSGGSRISISNSELYGCGSVGLTLNYASDLKCDNVNINDCSLTAVYLYQSHNITLSNTRLQSHETDGSILTAYDCYNLLLENCDIVDNDFKGSLIAFRGGFGAVLDNCRITDNRQNYDPGYEAGYFFKVIGFCGKGSWLQIKNSTISGNRCDYLADDEDMLIFENCKIENNSFCSP